MTETFLPAGTVPLGDGLTELQVSEPDPRWENDFHGLLYLGYLTGTFDWCGHKIVIHTLRSNERLIAALLAKDYLDTIGATRAHVAATVALAVDSVDGQPLPVPLGEESSAAPRVTDKWARDRFAYVQQWYEWTIDRIFAEHANLESRVLEILESLGKASPQAGLTPGQNASSASPSEGDS